MNDYVKKYEQELKNIVINGVYELKKDSRYRLKVLKVIGHMIYISNLQFENGFCCGSLPIWGFINSYKLIKSKQRQLEFNF